MLHCFLNNVFGLETMETYIFVINRLTKKKDHVIKEGFYLINKSIQNVN